MEKNGVFVGLSVLDILYGLARFPAPNSKNVATRQDIVAGGPATNAAVAFAHLGGKSTLITVIGKHLLGSIIKEDLSSCGVHLMDIAPDFEEAPTLSSIMVTEGTGDRVVVSANATRLPAPAKTPDLSTIDGSSIVLVDGHHMGICVEAARYAQSKGIRVVLDGGSWKPGMEQLLPFVGTVVCSENFLPPDCTSEHSVMEYILRQGVGEVAVTRGEKSILFASKSESGDLPVRRITAVDTLGAGDIFHGAFCYYYYHEGAPVFRAALEFASEIATCSCQYFGTRTWMLTDKPSSTKWR